jgi:uncharacterized protein YacL
MENLRAAVRPVVTFGLTAAFIAAAMGLGQETAVEYLREITLVVVAFWFGQRTT